MKRFYLSKFALSFFVAKFACWSFAVTFSDVNLLNPWVVIYLS